jgi:hypothetical protein
MGVADLRARGPVPLPSRLLRALDETAIREEILDPWEASDIMDFLEVCLMRSQSRADLLYEVLKIDRKIRGIFVMRTA